MNSSLLKNPLHALLLKSLHQETSTDTLEHFHTLNETQWTDLTREAIRLRLPYALDQFLQRNPDTAGLMPENCRVKLQNWQRKTLLTNLKRQGQLRQMIEACRSEEIPFLLMKGLWIVDQLYPHMGGRASGDIDILLKPDDMPRFTRLLQREGYALDPRIHDIRDISHENNEFPLPTLDDSSRFDIHWSMTHPRKESPINEAKIWARSITINLGGETCQTLSLEDHLLTLCFHAAIHHRFLYVGPRALIDIAQAIKMPPQPIQWEDFVARAREMGWNRGVWLMLDLVREHIGLQPPQPILDSLRPKNAEDTAIREASLTAMFLDQQQNEIMGVEVVKLFNQAAWSDRMAHLYRRLFPSPCFIASYYQLSIHHPHLPWLYPWLYVKRWVWILQKNLPKLARLASRDPRQKSELDRSQTIIRWLG